MIEKGKNTKAIIIVVLAVLLVGILGFMVWNMYFVNKETIISNSQANNSQPGSSNTDIDNVYKELREEITDLKATISSKDAEIANLKAQKEEAKTVYRHIVEDAVNEFQEKAARSSCEDKAWLYKSVRLPKINIDTKAVKKINEDIMKIDQEASTYKGGGDLEIDYTYKYIPSKNLLYILITRGVIAHCATGSVSYETYFYDVKKDKMLTPKELLSEYKIDTETLKDLADEELKEYLGEGQAEEYNDYKKRLDSIIKEERYTVFNADQRQIEVYFQVDLGGFTIKI